MNELATVVSISKPTGAVEAVSRQDRRSGRPRISAVMPCLNEERTLPICIAKAQESFRALGVDGEVIVADNGSTDRSAEIARSMGARVVHQPVKGYGAALQAGIEAALGDFIIMGDSDDSYDWAALGQFVEGLEGGCDLVMGNRFAGGIEPGAMPALHRYFGNPVLSFVSRLAFDVPVGDFHCGMRAFTRDAYDRMGVRTTGMEFATEMVAGAARNGLTIGEVPVRLFPDKRGRSPHLRSFRDGWRHLRFIVTYAPDFLYVWPGALLLLVGIALMATLVIGPVQLSGFYIGIHFLLLGGLLGVLGLNVLIMGVVAKIAVGVRFPGYASPFLRQLGTGFRVEHGLVAGAAIFVAGLAVNASILYRWLSAFGMPMDATIHPAFVATIAMIVGVNLGFASFVIRLLLDGRPNVPQLWPVK
jgi:glycosyltransferase involved in cell wall biosynthesis